MEQEWKQGTKRPLFEKQLERATLEAFDMCAGIVNKCVPANITNTHSTGKKNPGKNKYHFVFIFS
jgi:hypothetical protein